MSSDYEEIQVLPTGVYRVRYKRITPSQIKSLRTRTQKKLQELRRKQNAYHAMLNEIEAEMETVSRFLEESQRPEIDSYITRYDEQKEEAIERAEAFLQEFLGEEGYVKYRKNGYLELEDSLGDYWRVEADGTARKWIDGNLSRICVLRQRELPLPDHIVSVVQTIRELPETLRRDYRRR